MSQQTTEAPKAPKNIKAESADQKPFGRNNLLIMLVSAVLIVLGFILMSGGGSDDPNVFNPAIFSSTRIVIGPLLAFVGFVGIAVGIVVKPAKKN